MTKQRSELPFARLRMWGRGGYAVSLADNNERRYTLVEGDGRRSAHVVMVKGAQWMEITQSVVVWDVRPGTAVRKRLRRFPNGTVRLDVAERSGGPGLAAKLRRTSN